MKCALILAGCGQHDGSETHEVILTLLSLEQEKMAWNAYAPDVQQSSVVNHITETISPSETRSVLQESARLVRGRIEPLTNLNVSDFDALIFPGGFGAVTTLCDWFKKKAAFNFIPEVERVLHEAREQKIPMGFICIAPMMITKIYPGARFTIGNDASIAAEIQAMGCTHVDCSADEIVVDEKNRIVSTPANMVAKNINEVFMGIKKLVQALTYL